jgi:hypothetical protein
VKSTYYEALHYVIFILLLLPLSQLQIFSYIPEGVGNFPPNHCVQNSSGAHPASYQMGNRGSFPGQSGRGVKLTTYLHLVLRSKNEWSYNSTPQYAFIAWSSV